MSNKLPRHKTNIAIINPSLFLIVNKLLIHYLSNYLSCSENNVYFIPNYEDLLYLYNQILGHNKDNLKPYLTEI